MIGGPVHMICEECRRAIVVEDFEGCRAAFCSPQHCLAWQDARTERQIDEYFHLVRARCQWCRCRLSGGYHAEGCPVRPLGDTWHALRRELVAAQDELALDAAFEGLFDIVNEGRQGGKLDDVDLVLRWLAISPEVEQLHVDVMLSVVRLTCTLEPQLSSWRPALEAVERELVRRGEDVEVLIWGLRDRGKEAAKE